MNKILANWNGDILPLEDVRVSVLDRSFLFGDSVYEVIRVYGGRPWRLAEHMERLSNGLAALKITFSAAIAQQRLLATLQDSTHSEALGYLQISRGAAPRHHYYPHDAQPNCLIWIEPFQDSFQTYRETGARAITYPDIRWKRNDIKSTSLAANCMAAEAAHSQGCLEAIFINDADHLTEGSHSSIFAITGGKVAVTPSGAAVLPGITKRQLLELCAKTGVPTEQKTITRQELFSADEVILTATPEEIIGIVEIDGQPIGTGAPGPITKRLQQAFSETIQQWRNGG